MSWGQAEPMPDTQRQPPPSHAGRILAAIILAQGVGVIAYRLLVSHHLEQTSALFIGLPTILACFLALSRRPESATGVIMKGLAIALLMTAPLLAEGFICIVMSAPLFFGVGAIVGVCKDRDRKRGSSRAQALVLIPLALASLEGTHPALTFPKAQVVSATRLVAGSPADVEAALAETPAFDAPLPAFLRLRFPRPVAVSGAGLRVGDLRTIRFAGGEGKPGDLVLRVSHAAPGDMTFEAVSDESHVAHWLTWRRARVTWRDAGRGHCEVTWTLAYDRELSPAWYFGPWERLAAARAAGYLIESAATP